MVPWTARETEPPLRVPHHTASRGAVAGSRGRPGEVNLAHNGVLVIDQPTEFDRYTTDALVAVAEDGQTVTYRYIPFEHTIRMPARFRLMVTTRPDELDTRRHRAASLLDLCDIEITGGMPTDAAMPPGRLQAGRERVARAAAILESAPPRLVGGRAAYDTTSRRHPGRRRDRRGARRAPAARGRGPRRSRTPPLPRRSQMSARREPPPPIPIRQDLQHQHASRDRLAHERDAAERHAWDALGRYKFVIGYSCGIRVHLNRLCATPKPNPWRDLVAAARRATEKT